MGREEERAKGEGVGKRKRGVREVIKAADTGVEGRASCR